MNPYMMPTGSPVNGFPCLSGLPLFDWRPQPPVCRTSHRQVLAARIALHTGLPVGVVLAHFEAAGLGMEG